MHGFCRHYVEYSLKCWLVTQVNWFGVVGSAAFQVGSVALWPGANSQHASSTTSAALGTCVLRCCAITRQYSVQGINMSPPSKYVLCRVVIIAKVSVLIVTLAELWTRFCHHILCYWSSMIVPFCQLFVHCASVCHRNYLMLHTLFTQCDILCYLIATSQFSYRKYFQKMKMCIMFHDNKNKTRI